MKSTYGAVKGTSVEDWPITYDDLEPYYERAEYEIGVSAWPAPIRLQSPGKGRSRFLLCLSIRKEKSSATLACVWAGIPFRPPSRFSPNPTMADMLVFNAAGASLTLVK